RQGRFPYDRFPASANPTITDEKRKAILKAAEEKGSIDRLRLVNEEVDKRVENTGERLAERERMVKDIKVKIQGLWRKFLQIQDDPLYSSEFGTIHALIESDPEGAGGTGFVECLREHIIANGDCLMSEHHFTAVKELVRMFLLCNSRGNFQLQAAVCYLRTNLLISFDPLFI
ncbi:hypothetical protein CBR_g37927, partial [Chara braunii]